MSKIYLNTRYYKFLEDDNILELRTIGFYNSDTVKCIVTKGPESEIGKTIKIPTKTLSNDYTELIPDGKIIFSIVSVQRDLKDVMVTVLTKAKMDTGNNIPTVVCRQCVLDLFAKQFSNNHVDYTGLSISEETCPADVEFENFLACESIIDSLICNYYIGDKLDYVLSLFKHDKYDSTLSTILVDHCNTLRADNPGLADYFLRKGEANGYVNNLKDLLKLNNFEYDLYRAFNIIPTTLPAEHFSDGVLSIHAGNVLSDILRTKIYKSLVVKYDKDIDLDAIAKKYCLVSDNDGTVYVVAYFVDGTFYEELKDGDHEGNIDKLTTIFGTSRSTMNAYENIKFDQSKYKK